MGANKKQAANSLRAGRPPLAKSLQSISRKASRAMINKHHQLEKIRAQAIKTGDKQTEEDIVAEIASLGGLGHYQQISLQGQSLARGGDTSKVLLEWLPMVELKGQDRLAHMLEVGALSTQNACSTCGAFDIVHIDLNSQEPSIRQQDFMKRPLPESEEDKFEIISLSLVLNFVPDAASRGQMLQRTLSFLKTQLNAMSMGSNSHFPCLFVVLPRSCVDNSRYFTDTRFDEMMAALGYARVRNKKTQKLAYSLWKRVTEAISALPVFPKQEINPGRARNNFVITLERQPASLT